MLMMRNIFLLGFFFTLNFFALFEWNNSKRILFFLYDSFPMKNMSVIQFVSTMWLSISCFNENFVEVNALYEYLF